MKSLELRQCRSSRRGFCEDHERRDGRPVSRNPASGQLNGVWNKGQQVLFAGDAQYAELDAEKQALRSRPQFNGGSTWPNFPIDKIDTAIDLFPSIGTRRTYRASLVCRQHAVPRTRRPGRRSWLRPSSELKPDNRRLTADDGASIPRASDTAARTTPMAQ